MFRYLFISLFILLIMYFLLQEKLYRRTASIPVFLLTDTIANQHQTKNTLTVHSIFQPDSFRQQILIRDYSAIWAHLNHLYSTNDVEAGKEYYSEAFFKQLTRHHTSILSTPVSRTDEQHNLHIQNWASDGLVCTAIDSNLLLTYRYPDHTSKTMLTNLAVVLVFQGDHWRIDALRFLNQEEFQNLDTKAP